MGAELSQQPEQAGPDGGANPQVLPGSQQLHSVPVNSATVSEGELLSQLVQLLHQRPRCSLLLSDLGALLPTNLRTVVKEKGGLRSWLQKHPMLFHVSGHPGKESVTLTLGGNANPESSGGLQGDNRQGMPFANDAKNEQAKNEEDEEDTASCVQMRGLPYRATVADVKNFLGRHAAFLKDEHSVHLVLNRDGRPSGFARVQFKNSNVARAARDELHNARMATANQEGGASQERYVEIFLYSERANKLKFRKGQGEEQPDIQGMSKEQVIQECRLHMNAPGKSQLLLSMLGVALSPAARHYLKKTEFGLKHVLAQYPQEFGVEGAKGQECITYLPAMPAGYTVNVTPPTVYPAPSTAPQASTPQTSSNLTVAPPDTGKGRKQQRAAKGTPGPATGNINDLTHNATVEDLPFGLTSPLHMPVSPGVAGRGMATPSDWGTPTPYEAWELPKKTGSHETPKNLPTGNFAHGQTPNVFDTPHWAAWEMPPWGSMTSPMGMPPCGNGVGQVHAPWLQLDNPLGGGLTPAMAELVASLNPLVITQPSGMQQPGMQPLGATEDAEEECPTVGLRLRGLPFMCSEQDIFAFFAKHDVVEQIADVSKAVKMVLKPNGKSSGHAIVEMTSREAAEEARTQLHGQWMGTRYIEVFYNDEFERNEGEGSNSSPNPNVSSKPTIRNSEPMEIPTVSDTGGSGGMTAMMVPSSPLSSPMPSGWYGHGQVTPSSPWGSPSPSGDIDSFMAIANASRNQDMARQNAGGTGGETMLKDQGGSSWEALFDFLKKDNQPMANVRTASM